jgi:hypothetical protein
MAMVYVATAVSFVLNPDHAILLVNKIFAGYEWPVVFFPIERFWLSIAVGVPATRAFVAFAAARNRAPARFCVQVIQISLIIPGILFAYQFVFSKHAPIYVIGCLVEVVQILFYVFLRRKLP